MTHKKARFFVVVVCLFVGWFFLLFFFFVVVVVLVFSKSLSFYETYVHVIKLYEEGHKSKYQF